MSTNFMKMNQRNFQFLLTFGKCLLLNILGLYWPDVMFAQVQPQYVIKPVIY